MNVNSIGDQARAFALQAASGRIKATLAVLSKELSTGESADLAGRLRGNTQEITDITSRLAVLGQFRRNAAEIRFQTDAMMRTMEDVRTSTDELAVTLSSQPLTASNDLVSFHAQQASVTLDTVMSRLNIAIGGKYFFAGVNSDQPPLTTASELLDHLEQLTSGMTSAAQTATAVADWFDRPIGGGGFMDLVYRGSVGQGQSLPIGEDIVLELNLTAASPELRDQMKGLAMASLVDRGQLIVDVSEQRDLLHRAGKLMTQNAIKLTSAIGQLGFRQALISRTESDGSAAIATLELARNEIRQADPYATATAISEAETHLQSLYAVTARLSKLRLVDYLR
ncbi:hypothetical protein JJJ17_10605 [Paracoccus caeni]|uniref:Flagellin C-terminal domain-containing protein n=1 Tax=Paracoccus caeni TaxID=657651 RepID=A0A934VZZ5_9RHOB|nr:flagellin [Paracoccus caeni]MBK4216375.1 hypothetical protein [Paracoccus caeni]